MKYIPRLLGLLALIGVAYLGARLILIPLLPENVRLLALGILLLLGAIPLTYWLLVRRWGYMNELPFFQLPLDFLLPLSIYPVLLLMLFFNGPRYALWGWGAGARGEVEGIRLLERFDSDGGIMPATCIDYTFSVADQIYSKEACAGGWISTNLTVGDPVIVNFASWQPGLATAVVPVLYFSLDVLFLWGVLIVLGWLVGTALNSRRRYPPPPLLPPQTAVELLQRYGLTALLTAEDDPELWAAVVRRLFPLPEEDKGDGAGLRFGLGYYAPTTHMKMQPMTGNCFRRLDQYHFQFSDCRPDEKIDADFDEALEPTIPHRLLYIGKDGAGRPPLRAIIVPRPSRGDERLPVFTAVYHNRTAQGATTYWEKHSDSTWQDTKERLNWWYEGA